MLFSELHKEGPVLEAALLLLFLATSTRGMDSLVTQWKVDIRPDSPIINMNQGRVTMVNMFWLKDVIASYHGDHQQNQNVVKMTVAMFLMGGLGS